MSKQPYALDPDLQALVNEPLSEPPARARAHWTRLAEAMEQLDRSRARQTEIGANVNRLREELNVAKQRDRQALGRALEADEPEPDFEAPAIEAEIERNAARSAAMNGVLLEEHRRIRKLILRHKGGWQKDLQRHLADAAALYRTKIVELEQARQALVEEVQAGGWLNRFPETGAQVPTGPIKSGLMP